jgi:hypothetical protein
LRRGMTDLRGTSISRAAYSQGGRFTRLSRVWKKSLWRVSVQIFHLTSWIVFARCSGSPKATSFLLHGHFRLLGSPPPASSSRFHTCRCGVCTTLVFSTNTHSGAFSVKAVSNYTGADDKDLTFSVGDVIEVSKTSNDGWWTGRLVNGRRRQRDGRLFPANLVVADRGAASIHVPRTIVQVRSRSPQGYYSPG